jgi:diguanylate cyclase (GGDEF)-like protein/PAS domain S-box-containing protein
MNPAGLAMIEAECLEQVKGKSVLPLVAEEYREAFRELTSAVFRGEPRSLEFKMTGLKGRPLWVYTHTVPLRDESGRIVFALATTIDITERKQAEDRLRGSEEKYRCLVESTDDSIYLVDREHKYLFMNKKHLTRLGFPEGDFLGCAYGDLHSPEETVEFQRQVDWVFETGKSRKYEHMSLRDKRYFIRTLSPVKEANGNTAAVTIISKDVSELKKMQEDLRTLSLTDDLTGAFNRRGFIALCEQQLKMARRVNKGAYLLYADVDDLKLINDTFGHNEGSSLLVETVRILKSTYRESDIVARIGGDEFVVFPVGNAEEHVAATVERLKKNIDAYNAKKLRRYDLSVSVGVTYQQKRLKHV